MPLIANLHEGGSDSGWFDAAGHTLGPELREKIEEGIVERVSVSIKTDVGYEYTLHYRKAP